MRVFLPHGMGRSPMSMWLLALRLKKAGHRPSLFGYFVSLETFDQITTRFVRHVHQVLSEDRDSGQDISQWAVIGHSLGNIIARQANPRLPPGFARFVMLAPPNQLPASALKLRDNFLYKAITRDAGQTISDPAFYQTLPVPDVPSLVIAGDAGPSLDWLPFHGPHDSVVQVEETRLGDVPVLQISAMHTFMMNRRDVTDIILDFLEHGDGERLVTAAKTDRASA